MVKIIGHRGCRGEEPENTILGISKAISNNVNGIEIDVHLTKDNELVVIHDDSLDRTTNGKGKVADSTLGEIRKLDAGKGEKVPLLKEVIDVVKGAKKEIFIEIKCQGAEKKVVDAVIDNNILDLAFVKSFDHTIVKKAKELNREIRTACLIVGRPVHAYKLLDDAKADAISINANTVDKELIDECHSHGFAVFIWNADDPAELKKYIDMGADYIGTNVPSKVIS